MPNSIRKGIPALLCIIARFSLSASPAYDINVSQPSESDTAGDDAYHNGNLHNDSNQINSNHSILFHGSSLNQTSVGDSSDSQAVNASLWPSRLGVPPYSDVVIDIIREQPLTDASQAADIKTALLKLQPKVCADQQGRREIIQRSRVAHTWTEIFALCENEGFDLLDQKAKFTAALGVLYQGQEAYGPAAIYGEIKSLGINPRRIGQVGAHVLNVPPTARSSWPRGGMTIVRIHPSITLRLRVQTVAVHPALDIWDTMWFRKLCEQTQYWLRDQSLPPQTPIRSFWVQLDPYWKQKMTIRFEPLSVPGAEVATIEVLTNVMETLINVLDYYGARPMIFSVLTNDDRDIGVGYLEIGVVPPQLGVLNATTSDPVNETAEPGEADGTSVPDRNIAIE